MRAIIKKWVAQIVTISMMAGCVLPQGQTIWGGGNNTLSQNSATAPDSDDEWDGEIKLEIDPALMGEKYKHLKKVPFADNAEGEDFSIQSSRHYKNYKKYLKPEFQCVQSLPDGSYRAYFGYHNTNNNTITIPIGSKNKVLPAEPMRQWRHKKKKKFDQGQPTRFTPGRVGPFPNSAFSVDFDHGNVHWLLNGKTAKANKRSTRCPVGPTPTPQPTQTPSATPTPTQPPSPTPTPGGSPTPTPSVPPSPTPTPVPTDTPTPTPEPTEEPTPTPMPTPSDVVFDPADPSTLGDLFPEVLGNQNQPIPATNQAVFSINQTEPPQILTGEVFIQIVEPVEENLQEIVQTYNAYVFNNEGMSPDTRWISVDMTKVDLTQLEGNIHFLNSLLVDNPEHIIRNASFGNMESAKTFALMAELYASGKIKYVGFNGVQKATSGPFTTNENSFSEAAENSWWLNGNSTNINNAWNYSMGFNTLLQKPVKIAVIDAGFAGLSTLLSGEFKHQTEMNKGWRIREIPTIFGFPNYLDKGKWSQISNGLETGLSVEDRLMCKESGVSIAPFVSIPCNGTAPNPELIRTIGSRSDIVNMPEDHGTQVVSTIISQVNNGIGIAGVAPQAQVIPIKIGNGVNISNREIINAFSTLVSDPDLQDVGVVNMSIGPHPASYINTFLSIIALNLCKFSILPPTGCLTPTQTELNEYQGFIRTLTYRPSKTVVVLSAGNDAMSVDRQYYTQFREILSVGALDMSRGALERAAFSNWGNDINIWAPGVALSSWQIPNIGNENFYQPGTNLVVAPVAGKTPPLGSSVTPPQPVDWTGTSAAAPVVAGIVALIKAINPNLDKFQIETRLRETAQILTLRDSFLHEFPTFSLFSNCTIEGDLFGNPVNLPGLFNFTCPQIPLSDPRTNLVLHSLDAYEAVRRTAVENGVSPILEFRGTLDPSLPNTLNTSALGRLNLKYGTESNIGQFFAMLPPSPIFGGVSYTPISNLISGSREAIFEGRLNGNTLYAHLAKVPPPIVPSNKVWTLDLFNVNDQINVKINGMLTFTANYNASNPAQKTTYDISSLLIAGANRIEFETVNLDDNNTPGFAMGIELKADGVTVFRDVKGNASLRSHTATFGANRMTTGLGPRYQRTIFITPNGTIPGARPYRAEIFNTSDISNIKVNIVNTPISMQATSQYSADTIIDPYLNLSSVNDIDLEVYSAFSSLPFPSNPLHPNYKSYTWGFAIYSSEGLVYFNQDGQRENLDQTVNTLGQSIGSGANFNQPHNFLGEQVLKERWSPYVP